MNYYIYETPPDTGQLSSGVGPWHARKMWCKERCKGRWEYNGFGRFTFWDQFDYLLFLMRWS